VLTVAEECEVLELVVLFIAVNVVDVFVGEQRAVQLELHEEPVELVGGPPANFNHDVALAVEATAAPRPTGAEAARHSGA
jgi:hypothetical protein